MEFLRSRQDSHGRIGLTGAEGWIYNHAISLLALSRNCCLTKDARHRKPISRAAKYLLDVQNPGLGWKYEFRSGRNDTSVTCWAALALREAHKSGALEVPDSAFEGAANWLDRVTNTAGKAGYMRPGDDGSVIVDVNDTYEKYPSTTASALVTRMLNGQRRQDRKIMKGLRLILESQPPEWFEGETLRVDLYYSFWAATAAKILLPFEQRKEWTSRLISSILSIQKTSGKDAGSFSPEGKWGMVGGRVYSTAMAALALLRLRTDKPLGLTVEEHRRKRPENLTEAQPAEEQEQTWIPRGIKPTEDGPKTVEELAHILGTRTVTLCFNDTPLETVASFLKDISNCQFYLSREISSPELDQPTVMIRDIPLAQALEAICLSLGDIDYGLYKTESGVPVVVFSTPEDIAQRNLEKPDSFVPAIDCSSMKAKLYHHPCPFGLTEDELLKTAILETKLRERVKIDKPITTFGQLREFFEKSTGIPIRLSDEAARALADDTPVQSTDGEVRLSSLLHRARRAAGLYFVVSPDAVLFPSSETYVAMRWYAFNQYSLTKPALESKTVNLNVQEESLENIISFLQDLTGLNFVLSAAAREKAQDAEITMNVTDMRLDDALAEICRQAGLTYEARPNYILIKTHSE